MPLYGIAQKGEGFSRITLDMADVGETLHGPDGAQVALTEQDVIKRKGLMERALAVKFYPITNHSAKSTLGDFWPAH